MQWQHLRPKIHTMSTIARDMQFQRVKLTYTGLTFVKPPLMSGRDMKKTIKAW